MQDITGNYPDTECCVPGKQSANEEVESCDGYSLHPSSMSGGPDRIRSSLDMWQLQKDVKARGIQVDTSISEDAGRYALDVVAVTARGSCVYVHLLGICATSCIFSHSHLVKAQWRLCMYRV